MSLEKFQATDAWRNQLKAHLFAERKPTILARAPIKPTAHQIPKTPQRLSYQLSEELQVILEEKKIRRPVIENMPRVRVRDDEDGDDKENIIEFHKRIHASAASPRTPRKLERQSHVVDTTLVGDCAGEEDCNFTNTSFETLENMCEKTASDPNSTLFKYLRTNQTAPRTPILQRVASFDEEADALQRLLDELDIEEIENRFALNAPLANETLLDDIEAPSRLWENTLSTETMPSISPVKMVGLMRQSTIMEEYSDVSESSEYSSTSYQSAMKTGFSSETTECYETANDTAACSERGADKKVSVDNKERSASMELVQSDKKVSVDHKERSASMELFQPRQSRQRFFPDEEAEVEEGVESEEPEKSMNLMDFSLMQKDENDPLGESLQLIDLETTIKSPQDESLTSPASSPEKLEKEDESSSGNPLKSSLESSTQLAQSDESESFVIELSDDESDSADVSANKESKSVLNSSFTIKDEEPTMIDEEKSLHFNDTMEEVEYMMKKGMQYMQAAVKTPQKKSAEESPQKKSHLTPVKKYDRYRSPSPLLSSSSATASPRTVIAKPKPVSNNNKHALNIKPFPKLDLFKKPHGSATKPANKFTSSVKKQQYAHIVSPIGAYIKKTPTTPLISTVRSEAFGSGSSSPSSTASSSKAFRKLDCDSRVVSPSVGVCSPRQQSQNQVRSLPKKAYISSELKHIVDERTQFTIPGGPKIQRYLASAMIPAVVRHEGKVKIPANLRTSEMQPSASQPRRTDDSLADLSMVSGDVSVYTIKDAQKF